MAFKKPKTKVGNVSFPTLFSSSTEGEGILVVVVLTQTSIKWSAKNSLKNKWPFYFKTTSNGRGTVRWFRKKGWFLIWEWDWSSRVLIYTFINIKKHSKDVKMNLYELLQGLFSKTLRNIRVLFLADNEYDI